jgi:hypothetical protein
LASFSVANACRSVGCPHRLSGGGGSKLGRFEEIGAICIGNKAADDGGTATFFLRFRNRGGRDLGLRYDQGSVGAPFEHERKIAPLRFCRFQTVGQIFVQLDRFSHDRVVLILKTFR